MQKVVGSLIVGCVLACWLISNTNAQLIPPGGGGGTNNYDPPTSTFTAPDYGTNLWVAQAGIASGNLVGIISNTIPNIYFELQSKSDLVQDTQWVSSGFGVYGSEQTNWTPFSVAAVSPTNNLFLRIRSWVDSTGSGIPDWWWLQYFGSVGGDPFAFDPAGDGLTLWQDFEAGYNPTVFHPPPAPQGLTATFNADSTATVNWLPSPGPVTGYTVQRDYYNYFSGDQSETFNLPASSTSLHDTTPFTMPYLVGWYGLTIRVSYQIQTHYTGGDSAWSDPVWLEPGSPDMALVPGPQGSVYIAARNLPAGTTVLRFTRVDKYEEMYGDSPANAVSFDIPISAGTNGLYLIPAAWTTSPIDAFGYADYSWFVQPIDANGNGTSQATGPTYGYFDWFNNSTITWLVPPYFDGRVQLKQNLIFLFRAATVDSPFHHIENGYYGDSQEIIYFPNPATYEYAGFYQLGVTNWYNPYEFTGAFDPFWPFENNYRYLNFAYNTLNVNAGGQLATGVGLDYSPPLDYQPGLMVQFPPTNQFQPPVTSGTTIPAVLAANQWLVAYPMDLYWDWNQDPSDPSAKTVFPSIGFTGQWPGWDSDEDPIWTLAGGARNYWGLPYVSALLAGGDSGTITTTLSPGNAYQINDPNVYLGAAQPQFQRWNTISGITARCRGAQTSHPAKPAIC